MVNSWFKGIAPVAWHGWATVIAYLAWIGFTFFDAKRQSHSVSDLLLGFALPFILGTITLVIIRRTKSNR